MVDLDASPGLAATAAVPPAQGWRQLPRRPSSPGLAATARLSPTQGVVARVGPSQTNERKEAGHLGAGRALYGQKRLPAVSHPLVIPAAAIALIVGDRVGGDIGELAAIDCPTRAPLARKRHLRLATGSPGQRVPASLQPRVIPASAMALIAPAWVDPAMTSLKRLSSTGARSSARARKLAIWAPDHGFGAERVGVAPGGYPGVVDGEDCLGGCRRSICRRTEALVLVTPRRWGERVPNVW